MGTHSSRQPLTVTGDEPPSQRALRREPFTIRVIPSGDVAFASHVRSAIARLERARPDVLQDRLRAIYPFVVVRPRDLAGESAVWYVYREGRWQPDVEEAWWTDQALPHLWVDRDGSISAANDAADAFLAVAPGTLVGRNLREFVVPDGMDEARQLFAIVLQVGRMTSTGVLRAADGRDRVLQFRVVVDGPVIDVVLRPI